MHVIIQILSYCSAAVAKACSTCHFFKKPIKKTGISFPPIRVRRHSDPFPSHFRLQKGSFRVRWHSDPFPNHFKLQKSSFRAGLVGHTQSPFSDAFLDSQRLNFSRLGRMRSNAAITSYHYNIIIVLFPPPLDPKS